MKVKCKECGSSFEIPNDVIKGEIVTCPHCGIDYEVVEVNHGSVQLKIAENIKEDWGE